MTHRQRGAAAILSIIGVFVVLLLVVGGGYYLTQQLVAPSAEERAPAARKDVPASATKDAVRTFNQAPQGGTHTQPAAVYSGEVLAGTSAPLLVFNQVDYDKAVAEGKLVVLYFYANWCPICRAEFPKAEAAFDQLTSDNVVGFRVNFNDNETDQSEEALARRFGVPYQHTKVFVRGGEQVLKSPEEWDTGRYLTEIEGRL